MANKDLNLALDQNLMQPNETQQSRVQDHSTPPNYEAANLDIAGSNSPNNYQRQSKPYGRPSLVTNWLTAIKDGSFPWLTAGLIFINLLFLLLVGLWLLGQNNQSTTLTPSKIIPPKAVSSDLANNEVIKAFNQQLITLQTKVKEIELTLHEQQNLIASSSKGLSNDIQQLEHQLKNIELSNKEKITPAPKKETPKAALKPPTTHWYVNIGTFASQDAAQRLQKQLLGLGYSVQINTISIDNKSAYRVQLPGFNDREAAELAARRIMDKTNLNGLWAWNDE